MTYREIQKAKAQEKRGFWERAFPVTIRRGELVQHLEVQPVCLRDRQIETITIKRLDTGAVFVGFADFAMSLGVVGLTRDAIGKAGWNGKLARMSPVERERALHFRAGEERVERALARERAMKNRGEDGQPGSPMAFTPGNIKPIFKKRQTKAEQERTGRWLHWGYWINAIRRGETDVTFKTWYTHQDEFLKAQARGETGNKTFDEWVADREAKRRDGASGAGGGAAGGGAGTPKEA